jgi:hypothetical protein
MAPHDEISAVTSSGKKGSAAMRTSVTVAYLINNAPIRPNREICIIDTHPGLFDAVSLTDLLSVATSTYQLLQGNFTAAGAAILPLLRETYNGKNTIASTTGHLTFQQDGSFLVNGNRLHPDEIRVVFRATSEDDLTTSFGRVDQSANVLGRQVRDNGEQSENHQYTRRFSIPLRTITPGDYIFTFGSGDDGWLFDVGASTILTLTITPAPAQPSQAVTPAEEAASR